MEAAAAETIQREIHAQDRQDLRLSNTADDPISPNPAKGEVLICLFVFYLQAVQISLYFEAMQANLSQRSDGNGSGAPTSLRALKPQ